MGDLHSAVAVLTEVAGMAEQYGGRPVESVYADIMARSAGVTGALHLCVGGEGAFIVPFFLSGARCFASSCCC